MIRCNWCCWMLVSLIAFAGCSGGSGVATVPVTGVVTLDSQPVEGATISFAPKSADGVTAAGVTDSSGRFSLSTTGGEGAVPGSYAVTISKAAVGGTTQSADPRESGGSLSPEQAEAMAETAQAETARRPAAGAASGSPASALPQRYASPDGSGFTAEVKSGEKNEFTFDMTSQ